MKNILNTILFIGIFILMLVKIYSITKRKERESKKLLRYLLMLLSREDMDYYQILEALQSVSDVFYMKLTKMTMDQIRNDENLESENRNNIYEKCLFNTLKVVKEVSVKAAYEYILYEFQIIERNDVRLKKMEEEGTHAIGIILTMGMIFLVVLYYLEPMMDLYSSFGI